MPTQTEVADLTAEDVLRETYNQLVARNNARTITFTRDSPGPHFYGRAITVIGRTFDSYEGESIANMSYGKADVFTIEGRHYAIALGTHSGGGRCGSKFRADIALLGLKIPCLSQNPIMRVFQRLTDKDVERDSELEIIQGLSDGEYFRDTIVAVKEPGLLKFNSGLDKRVCLYSEHPERSLTSVKLHYAAGTVRKNIETKFCPSIQEFMTRAAEFRESRTIGQIRYRSETVPALADAIEDSIREHAKTWKD
ncbi:hypothetical protein HY642_00055 [Candidatus Woesearchaeota archaeon]|nr:hypothetical protein [Candidatus Woesearchaeota archaeon]